MTALLLSLIIRSPIISFYIICITILSFWRLIPIGVFIVISIPIILFYIAIRCFGLVDMHNLFESKREEKSFIKKCMLLLIVLSIIIHLLMLWTPKSSNFNILINTSVFIVPFLFILYISIKKFKKVRLYKLTGYSSMIDFLHEILFTVFHVSLGIIFAKIIPNDTTLFFKYYLIIVCLYILFKVIFFIIGKEPSKKESLKNIILYFSSCIFSLIILSIDSFKVASDDSLILFFTYLLPAFLEAGIPYLLTDHFTKPQRKKRP